MQMFLNGKPKYSPEGLLGYLVLNAKTTPEFPLLAPSLPPVPHLGGSPNGIFKCSASEQHSFFNPSRSVAYTAYSNRGFASVEQLQPIQQFLQELPLLLGPDDSFVEVLRQGLWGRVPPTTGLVLESSAPLGLTVLASSHVDLNVFGLYNDSQSLLVFTTIGNFEALLHREHGDRFWLFRFAQRSTAVASIFTRRVCARWYRWSQTPAMLPIANRFSALEKSLFKDDLHEHP